MALTTIAPVPAIVRWEIGATHPSHVSWGGNEMRVTRLSAVRDERRAYRRERGPRLTMVVEADCGEAVLVFDARRRRWYVEALDLAA